MAANRLTYRRRLSYNTRSNRTKVSKTPGGKLVYLYPKKPGTVPKCAECKSKLRGFHTKRSAELGRMSKTQKRINRSYGGNLCGHCLRDRIMRAFLTEENNMVKNALKARSQAAAKSSQQK